MVVSAVCFHLSHRVTVRLTMSTSVNYTAITGHTPLCCFTLRDSLCYTKSCTLCSISSNIVKITLYTASNSKLSPKNHTQVTRLISLKMHIDRLEALSNRTTTAAATGGSKVVATVGSELTGETVHRTFVYCKHFDALDSKCLHNIALQPELMYDSYL
jgi:hypothetical protein